MYQKPLFAFWLYLFTLLLVFPFCSRQQIDAPEPIKKLIWQTRTATNADCTSCPPAVFKYVWNNKILYGFTCSGPACTCTITFYDESGEKVIITANDRPNVEFVKAI